jgi:hypothetical protein
MIRKRLTNTKQSEGESAQPRRRRISRIPSPSLLSDERDLSDADLRAAKLAESFRAERVRVRDAIRRAIGNDLLSVVQEGLTNMSGKGRRRVQSRLDHLLARQ